MTFRLVPYAEVITAQAAGWRIVAGWLNARNRHARYRLLMVLT